MKKVRFYLLLLLAYTLCFFVAVTLVRWYKTYAPVTSAVYRERGLSAGLAGSKPLILGNPYNIRSLAESGIPDTVAALTPKGELVLLGINLQGKIKRTPIIPGYPYAWGDLYSDSENRVLWLDAGKRLYFLDIDSKLKGIVKIPDYDNYGVNTGLTAVFPVEPALKWYAIVYKFDGINYFTVYDLVHHKLIEPWKSGNPIPFYERQLLNTYNKVDNGFISDIIWECIDLSGKHKSQNQLTQVLTENQLEVPSLVRAFDLKKRIIVGISHVFNHCSIIRWDPNVKAINVTLIKRSPEELIDSLSISPDGNWLKVVIHKVNHESRELYFYNIRVEGNLNGPIPGGLTTVNNPGAFMKHRIWGTCYIEQDLKFPHQLLVYKLGKK